MRKKIKKIITSALLALLMVVNSVTPVKTAASAVAVGLSLYEAVQTLVLSLGSTYLVYEGAEKTGVIDDLKNAFSKYVTGTGAKKWDAVKESQLKLYKKGSLNEEGGDDKEPSDDEKLSFMENLAVNSALVDCIYDFYNDFFADSDGVLSPDYVAKSFLKYPDQPGFISRVCFGQGPYFSSLESKFTTAGKTFCEGSCVARVKKTDNNQAYDKVVKIVKQNELSDIIPFLELQKSPAFGGKDVQDLQIQISATVDGKINGVVEGTLENSDGSKNLYPLLPSYDAYYASKLAVIYDSDSFGHFSASTCEYIYQQSDDLLYWNIPNSLVVDRYSGLSFFYDGSQLKRRIYDEFGGFVEKGVDGGFIYNIDGTYHSLQDIYPQTKADEFILDRIKELQDFLQTKFPDEVPYINYSDLEGLQPKINEAQMNQVGEYPVQQPNSQEVPSEYPKQVDELIQSTIKNPDTNPNPNPGTNTGTDADPNPNPDTQPNPWEDPDIKPDTDTENKGFLPSGAGDFALDLADFFPFCIPRDLYALMQILGQSPKAPVLKWNVPTLVKGGHSNNIITVDLSPWDSAAAIFRTIQRVVLMYALLSLSKRFVKGG